MGASYGPSDEQDKRTELFVVISSCYCSYNYWPDFIEGTVAITIDKLTMSQTQPPWAYSTDYWNKAKLML